jgi:hypothetical protein
MGVGPGADGARGDHPECAGIARATVATAPTETARRPAGNDAEGRRIMTRPNDVENATRIATERHVFVEHLRTENDREHASIDRAGSAPVPAFLRS